MKEGANRGGLTCPPVQRAGGHWLNTVRLAGFANLLHDLEVQEPLPKFFILYAFMAALHRAQPAGKIDFQCHPLWFMRALLREMSKAPTTAGPALPRGELRVCLDWLVEAEPAPDTNQQKAGWSWIREQALAWRNARELARLAPFPIAVHEMIFGLSKWGVRNEGPNDTGPDRHA